MGPVRAVDIALSPTDAHDPLLVRAAAAEAAGLRIDQVVSHRLLRRSVDARSKRPLIRLRVELCTEVVPVHNAAPDQPLPDVSHAPRVLIVGCGPAGLFAALRAIANGLCPILLERGKDVRARRRDPLPRRRLLTVEIAIIDGVNGSDQMARSLVALLR